MCRSIDPTHGRRTNVQPPSIVLLALAVWQCGAMLLFEDAGNRWLQRPRAWRSVIAANSMVMTFYLMEHECGRGCGSDPVPHRTRPSRSRSAPRGGCCVPYGGSRARSASCRSCSPSAGRSGRFRRRPRRSMAGLRWCSRCSESRRPPWGWHAGGERIPGARRGSAAALTVAVGAVIVSGVLLRVDPRAAEANAAPFRRHGPAGSFRQRTTSDDP